MQLVPAGTSTGTGTCVLLLAGVGACVCDGIGVLVCVLVAARTSLCLAVLPASLGLFSHSGNPFAECTQNTGVHRKGPYFFDPRRSTVATRFHLGSSQGRCLVRLPPGIPASPLPPHLGTSMASSAPRPGQSDSGHGFSAALHASRGSGDQMLSQAGCATVLVFSTRWWPGC